MKSVDVVLLTTFQHQIIDVSQSQFFGAMKVPVLSRGEEKAQGSGQDLPPSAKGTLK